MDDVVLTCPHCDTKLKVPEQRRNMTNKCPKCRGEIKTTPTKKQQQLADFIVTTTNSIENHAIEQYLGVVTGDTILGINVFRDLMAKVRDVVGGRSETYEKAMSTSRVSALKEMKQKAITLEADAVIGVKLDYEFLGAENGMLMVTASGTAVRLQNNDEGKHNK